MTDNRFAVFDRSWYDGHAKAFELIRVLGPMWTVVRGTLHNRTRHGLCIGSREYSEPVSVALNERERLAKAALI